MVYVAVMVGKFVKQVVREWCPSTTGPLLPTMIEWAGYLVPPDVLPPFPNIVAHQTVCPTNTLVRTVLIWDQIVRWTRGGGIYPGPAPLEGGHTECFTLYFVDSALRLRSLPGAWQVYIHLLPPLLHLVKNLHS